MDSTFCLFDDGRAADAAAAVRDPRSGGEVIDLEPTAAPRDIDGRSGGAGGGPVAGPRGGAGGGPPRAAHPPGGGGGATPPVLPGGDRLGGGANVTDRGSRDR